MGQGGRGDGPAGRGSRAGMLRAAAGEGGRAGGCGAPTLRCSSLVLHTASSTASSEACSTNWWRYWACCCARAGARRGSSCAAGPQLPGELGAGPPESAASRPFLARRPHLLGARQVDLVDGVVLLPHDDEGAHAGAVRHRGDRAARPACRCGNGRSGRYHAIVRPAGSAARGTSHCPCAGEAGNGSGAGRSAAPRVVVALFHHAVLGRAGLGTLLASEWGRRQECTEEGRGTVAVREAGNAPVLGSFSPRAGAGCGARVSPSANPSLAAA